MPSAAGYPREAASIVERAADKPAVIVTGGGANRENLP